MDAQTLQYKKMTETPIPKLIVKLGIPTTVSMLITSVYNMADTYFVGKYGATDPIESTSASGAIGVVFGLMAIIQAFGFMFGQGAGVLSSRSLGQRDSERATAYASGGFFAAAAMGLLLAVFGIWQIEPFMRLLGSTDTILPFARKYAFYILLAAPFMCSSCVLNNVLRFEGRALFAMIGLGAGGLLNIFGDYILMVKFGMGVEGAGISTAISQTVGFFLLLSMFLRGKTSSKLSFARIPTEVGAYLEICKVGFPSLVRQGLGSVSTMLLNNYAGVLGDDAAVSAMSIVNRICFFTFATSLGIGQGFQPVCSFNYGAKKYRRVTKGFVFTLSVGEVLLGAVAIGGLFCAEPILWLFTENETVVEIGKVALVAQFIGQVFQPAAVCANMLFQSVGKAGVATVLAMLRSGLFFIPTLLLLSHWQGLLGVQLAQAIADVLTMIVALPFAIRFILQLRKMSET